MKVTVFGSTGSVGRNIVEQALAQGHQITAHTRSPEKFEKPHKNLKIVKGDVLDAASVQAAVEGADAVICALGMPLMNKQGLRTKGTKLIVSAMEKAAVKRLICLSALGANESRAILPTHYRYFIIPLFMRHLFADHEPQEKLVKASDLDWVIVRPGNFTKGIRSGKYQHGFKVLDKSIKIKISQEDVADFMVKQLSDDRYLQKAVSLSY